MDRRFRRLLPGLLSLGCLCWLASIGQAQDDAQPPPPDTAAPDAAAAETFVPSDAKRPPLVGEPKTPDELFEATLLMVDVARVDLAKLYLDKLMDEPRGG